jgi:hypothetical protein
MAGISKYSTTPGSNNAAAPDGFKENMRPSEVNDSARQVMADIRTWYEDAEWLKLGENGNTNAFSISFVSTTAFLFTGTDRRTLVPINRRVKAGVGAGEIYGTVTDSTLSASDTKITVAWDSGVLDSSLSYISLGILSPSNNSLPRNLDASFSDLTVTGILSTPYASRAWGYITNTGSPALAASLGITSLSDVSKGVTQLKFSISMSTSDYAVLALQDSAGSPIVSARSASQFNITTRDSSLSVTDVHFNFVVFGKQ